MSDQVGRPIGERYLLLDPIAVGGMATVHFGRLRGAVGFSRLVAIKQLHAQFASDPDFVTMFVDEARLASRIRHTNVVPVLDVVSFEDQLYLVMEYVAGASLSELLRAQDWRVPLPVALGIITGALAGLQAAHEARDERGELLGIVHRDVSPQNMLVGTDGVTRLADFGIARAAGRLHSTRGDRLKGKLAYMAPEQLDRESLDRRTDLYAAGIVLWELLTATRLFAADDEVSTLDKAREAHVQPPSAVASSVPRALDAVALRALARNPDDRFATAEEMLSALEATGLVGAHREVAEWVQQVAADRLADHAARVQELEQRLSIPPDQDGIPSGMPSPVGNRLRAAEAETVVEPPQDGAATPSGILVPRRRPRWALPVAVGATLLVGAVAGALALRGDGAGGARDARGETSAPGASEVGPTAPGPTTSAATGATNAATSSPSIPPASASAAATKRPRGRPIRGRPARGPRRPDDCANPFTVDRDGVRIPKRHCL